ncbi:MAG: hypothetical protein LBM73_03445 [Candidatus Nomurabacteria bacterium]|jgi:hypothetical protein|nr:hypothetical protein [Candidatus Nomurabacteria bacterium]
MDARNSSTNNLPATRTPEAAVVYESTVVERLTNDGSGLTVDVDKMTVVERITYWTDKATGAAEPTLTAVDAKYVSDAQQQVRITLTNQHAAKTLPSATTYQTLPADPTNYTYVLPNQIKPTNNFNQ